MISRVFIIPAKNVRVGDILPGGMAVADVAHGPLDHQIRFRDHTETATSFRNSDELVMVERKSRS